MTSCTTKQLLRKQSAIVTIIMQISLITTYPRNERTFTLIFFPPCYSIQKKSRLGFSVSILRFRMTKERMSHKHKVFLTHRVFYSENTWSNTSQLLISCLVSEMISSMSAVEIYLYFDFLDLLKFC